MDWCLHSQRPETRGQSARLPELGAARNARRLYAFVTHACVNNPHKCLTAPRTHHLALRVQYGKTNLARKR